MDYIRFRVCLLSIIAIFPYSTRSIVVRDFVLETHFFMGLI